MALFWELPAFPFAYVERRKQGAHTSVPFHELSSKLSPGTTEQATTLTETTLIKSNTAYKCGTEWRNPVTSNTMLDLFQTSLLFSASVLFFSFNYQQESIFL